MHAYASSNKFSISISVERLFCNNFLNDLLFYIEMNIRKYMEGFVIRITRVVRNFKKLRCFG